MITETQLNYWGEIYEALNDKHELARKHQMGFANFLAMLHVDPERYRLLNIYLANPGLANSGVTLQHFIYNPHIAIQALFKTTPMPFADCLPLLKKQSQAATSFEFNSQALIDYWEERLDRYQQQECHGELMMQAVHKRNKVPFWKRGFKRKGKAQQIRAARYTRMGKDGFLKIPVPE